MNLEFIAFVSIVVITAAVIIYIANRFFRLRERKLEIEAMNAALPKLASFILPGGTAGAAQAHVARTIARRAERELVRLAAEEPVNMALVRYMNRLSDHLFVLARMLNDNGAGDILWVPGGNLGA